MAGEVYLTVDRDKLTGGIQLSIGDDDSGYRLAGPKYSGNSETVRRHALTKDDADRIHAYLRQVK